MAMMPQGFSGGLGTNAPAQPRMSAPMAPAQYTEWFNGVAKMMAPTNYEQWLKGFTDMTKQMLGDDAKIPDGIPAVSEYQKRFEEWQENMNPTRYAKWFEQFAPATTPPKP